MILSVTIKYCTVEVMNYNIYRSRNVALIIIIIRLHVFFLWPFSVFRINSVKTLTFFISVGTVHFYQNGRQK